MANVRRSPDVVDVVVVGCGAGGSVVAKELAEAGLSVVVLEAGRRYDPLREYRGNRDDFPHQASKIFGAEDPRRDLYASGPRGYRYNRVKGVGGTTLVSWGVSPRFHEADFSAGAVDGVGADWPVSYADIEPYYVRVEYELGMAGESGEQGNPFDSPRSLAYPTPPHLMSLSSRTIAQGAHRLGLHPYVPPLAIPTKDWQGRPACIEAGVCGYGCRISAKSSADVTYVRKAEETGRVEIRPLSMARQIILDRKSVARSVIYFDATGEEHEVSARAIVLAGNAIETPRLLLLSPSTLFPQGLGNSSGLIGKYLTEHIDAGIRAYFPQPLENWKGVPVSVMIQDFYDSRPNRGFSGGWLLEAAAWGNTPVAAARRVGGWGSVHKQEMKRQYGHELELMGQGVQVPDIRNYVSLDPVRTDMWGLPVPYLASELRENDTALLNAMRRSLNEVLAASGADSILHEWSHVPGASSHYMGTCRMGANPDSSVTDPWCRLHDVKNVFIADSSVFVSSGAAHPTPTLMALATRTADFMIEQFRQGEL